MEKLNFCFIRYIAENINKFVTCSIKFLTSSLNFFLFLCNESRQSVEKLFIKAVFHLQQNIGLKCKNCRKPCGQSNSLTICRVVTFLN